MCVLCKNRGTISPVPNFFLVENVGKEEWEEKDSLIKHHTH